MLCLPVPPHTLALSSTFLFPATFRARKQSFRRSPWVNFCNKLGTFGQTLQSQRSASKDVVDEGARRIDLTRRGGTSPTLPPPLPLYHLVHHPSITITQTHYRHQSWSCAALGDKAAVPLRILRRGNLRWKRGGVNVYSARR